MKTTKLSDKKREEMFLAFVEHNSNLYVSKKCNVSTTTVRRYRKIDKWDERLKKIKEKSQERLDMEIAKIREEDLKIVREVKEKLLDSVKNDSADYSKLDIALDKIIRLEMFLLGEADEHKQVDLSNVTINFGDIDNE